MEISNTRIVYNHNICHDFWMEISDTYFMIIYPGLYYVSAGIHKNIDFFSHSTGTLGNI